VAPTRLDHAILAVDDLTAAAATFTRLGFRVTPGGEHPNWGTHNSIVRFGLDYLELLAIRDPEEAEQTGFGFPVLRYLERGEGWFGYAVGTDDATADAEEIARRGAEVEGPFSGERMRPDGVLLQWRTVGLGPPMARRAVPFLIQHLPGDSERLQRFELEGALGGHPLGVRRLRSVTIAVRDLEAAERVYVDHLGLYPIGYEENTWLDAATAWLQLGNDLVILASPRSSSSPVAAELDVRGEGLFSIEVEVDSLDAAVQHVTSAGFAVERAGTGRTVLLRPEQLHGGRLALAQA
jgi:catechol 2,3-dioxygenase-like lactoylglutathione lyase family enzyme